MKVSLKKKKHTQTSIDDIFNIPIIELLRLLLTLWAKLDSSRWLIVGEELWDGGTPLGQRGRQRTLLLPPYKGRSIVTRQGLTDC